MYSKYSLSSQDILPLCSAFYSGRAAGPCRATLLLWTATQYASVPPLLGRYFLQYHCSVASQKTLQGESDVFMWVPECWQLNPCLHLHITDTTKMFKSANMQIFEDKVEQCVSLFIGGAICPECSHDVSSYIYVYLWPPKKKKISVFLFFFLTVALHYDDLNCKITSHTLSGGGVISATPCHTQLMPMTDTNFFKHSVISAVQQQSDPIST